MITAEKLIRVTQAPQLVEQIAKNGFKDAMTYQPIKSTNPLYLRGYQEGKRIHRNIKKLEVTIKNDRN